MARAFSPEIGDMGGSNVTPYTPPSLDFSSIARGVTNSMKILGNAMEDSGGGKLTESDKKGLQLAPVVEDLQRASQIEDMATRDATLKLIKKRADRTLSQYREDIQQFYDEVRGEALPLGTPQEYETEQLKKFMDTPEGQASMARATILATRKDGTKDEDLLRHNLRLDYLRIIRDQETQAHATRQVESGKMTREVAWRQQVPILTQEANDSFNTFVSEAGINELLKLSPEGQEFQIESLISLIDTQINYLDSKANTFKGSIQITESEGEFSNNNILSQWTNLKKSLETHSNQLQNAVNKLSKNEIAGFLTKLIRDTNGNIPLGLKTVLADPRSASEFFVPLLEKNPQKIDFVNQMAQYNSPAPFAGPPNPTDVTLISPDGSPLTASDRETVLMFPEFSSNQTIATKKMSTDEKQGRVKAAVTFISGVDPTDIDKDGVNYTAGTMSEGYMSLLLRGDDASPTTNAQALSVFGPKAFTVMDQVYKQDQKTGMILYKQAHKYGVDEFNRQLKNFNNILNTMSLPQGMFRPTIKNGGIELEIDPKALQTNENLKATIQALRNENNGAEPTVQEIMIRSMDTFISGPEAIGNRPSIFSNFGRKTELERTMTVLNTLYKNFDRMPDDIKNSQAFGQKYVVNMFNDYKKALPYNSLSLSSKAKRTITLDDIQRDMEMGVAP